MTYYYSLLTLFAIIAAMMIIDNNVCDFILILPKIIKIQLQRVYWMIRFHPVILSSPIGRWWMMRKYMRTIKELSQELPKSTESDVK